MEVEAARAQQLGGALHGLVTLDVLDPDVEQPHARPLLVLDRGDQHRAHHAELHELLRRAIDVGAQIQHVGEGSFLVRQHGGNRRSVDAGDSFQHEARDRHQGAGIARAHRRVRLAFLDEVDGDAHRRILLVAQCLGRRFVHCHYFARRMHPQLLAGDSTAGFQLGVDRLAHADQHDRDVPRASLEVERGRHRHMGAVVAAHAIDRQRNPRRCQRGLLAFGADDLLAAVEPGGTNVVAQVRLSRRRLDRHRGRAEMVVRAVHAASRR